MDAVVVVNGRSNRRAFQIWRPLIFFQLQFQIIQNYSSIFFNYSLTFKGRLIYLSQALVVVVGELWSPLARGISRQRASIVRRAVLGERRERGLDRRRSPL
jgi:hypothetical protein